MKKITTVFCLIFCLFASDMRGDIIIVSRTFKVQVCINNLNSFSDIVVVGIYRSPSRSQRPDAKRIVQNTDIQTEFSYPLALYAIKADYFKKVGIDNVNYDDSKNVLEIESPVDYGKIEDNSYQSVVRYYSLKRKFEIFTLIKDSTVYTYLNGKRNVVNDRR